MTVVLSADAVLDLADACNSSPLARVIAFGIERADANGVAVFDEDELRELVSDRLDYPLTTRGLRGLCNLAVKHGHCVTAKPERMTFDPARVRGQGSGLRVVSELDGGRALAECNTCGNRRTYSRTYLAGDAARCGACAKAVRGSR